MCFYFFRIILKEIFIEDLYILTCHLAYREICSVIGIDNSYFFLFMIKHLFSFHFFLVGKHKMIYKEESLKKNKHEMQIQRMSSGARSTGLLQWYFDLCKSSIRRVFLFRYLLHWAKKKYIKKSSSHNSELHYFWYVEKLNDRFNIDITLKFSFFFFFKRYKFM